LEALTLNPCPKKGEGLKISLALLRPFWEKGLGDEGLIRQEALTLNPCPKKGEGLKISLAPLRPFWEKGLGDEGLTRPSEIRIPA